MGMESLPVVSWKSQLYTIQPAILLAMAVISCIMLDLFDQASKKIPCWIISLLGCLMALFVTLRDWGSPARPAFSHLVHVDNFTLFFNVIFLVTGIITLLLSMKYVTREKILPGEYCTLLLICLIGMFFLASANDLMTLFVGLEVMSIPAYILVGMMKGHSKSPEAAIKYLLLGGFASAFLLFGIAMLYGAVGSTQLPALVKAAKGLTADKSPLFFGGVGFLLAGMSFKISLVPFHMWTPDVYEGAPTPITAFMSAAVKAAGFSVLIRVIVISIGSMAIDWPTVFMALAIVTMIAGNVVALVQENIKRMLAYSSIAHAGYVMVALTPGTEVGLQAALIYLFIYALMNLGAFGVIIALSKKEDVGTDLNDLKGLARTYPLYGVAMAIFMFSLAGVPPTGGFIGKFYAFMAAIKSGYIGLAVIGVLMSAVSAYFYLRVLVMMYMQESDAAETPASDRLLNNAPAVVFSLWLCALAVLFLGIKPGVLSQFAKEALSGLFF